jgi:GTP-binding protein HflX
MGGRAPHAAAPEADRALVATLVLPGSAAEEVADPLDEIKALAEAAGADVVGGIVQRLPRIQARAAFGKGKIEEIGALAKELGAKVVIVDHALSPSQGMNLEKDLGLRVVDRTELILDIFATRAQTRQAALQVELAQLEYMKTRLRRMWTHLERTEGAVGSRGPGETQLETDRRLVNRKIVDLKRKLATIEVRRRREAVNREYPCTVSLVGYTNVGKSSLMVRLTGSEVLVADQLFATLDTRIRNWRLGEGRQVVLADTVGFVRDLPHGLVASFHATLEETIQADLLLHVCDASAPDLELQIASVDGVLAEIGAAEIPTILVLNKLDRVDEDERLLLEQRYPDAIQASVQDGEGLDRLHDAVAAFLDRWALRMEVSVPASRGRLLADLRKVASVKQEGYEEDRWVAELHLMPRHWSALRPEIEAAGGAFQVLS